MRALVVQLHRWAGLTMTIFLVIVSLTGSILAFHKELDRWLNADLFQAPAGKGLPLSNFELRERAEALESHANVDLIELTHVSGRAFSVSLSPKIDPATNKPFALAANQLFLNPFTGAPIGSRNADEISFGRRGFLNFILALHTSLAAPESIAVGSRMLLGVIALVWTIDCFLGFYLTLPARVSARHARTLQRSWWSRWKRSWLIRRTGGRYCLNLDIHRAFGLWTWAMLFVFAWSGVSFNLNSVYMPVMRAAFDMGEIGREHKIIQDTPVDAPKLGFREAYLRGRELMAQVAKEKGLTIEEEKAIALVRAEGQYAYVVRVSSLPLDDGSTAVFFDANSGALLRVLHIGDDRPGEAITHWLMFLHMAMIFGLPMKIVVSLMGIVATVLSITGVYIWWKKRKARVAQARRRAGDWSRGEVTRVETI